MAKDERRLASQAGHTIERDLQTDVNTVIKRLIDMQAYALKIRNEELAQMVNDLMMTPLLMSQKLNMWSKDEINALIERIESEK